jgi:hypothetical protein
MAMVIAMAALLASACVPLPQRVKDEFTPPNGQRPNNFEIGGSDGSSASADAAKISDGGAAGQGN